MPPEKAVQIEPGGRQRRGLDTISRRVLIGGASTAIVVSAAGAGRARGVFDRAGGHAPEAELSAVFLSNARGFHAAAFTARDRFPRQAAHFLAIAIELSLKSYLLHCGFSDDWNRIHLGHDLVKALTYARRAGLHDVPSDLPALVALLSPYYRRHAFDELSLVAIAGLCGSNAHDAVRALQGGVGDAISRAAPWGRSTFTPPEFR